MIVRITAAELNPALERAGEEPLMAPRARRQIAQCWAKRVTPETVDLTQPGGYALRAPFVAYGKAVSVADGEYLFVRWWDREFLLETQGDELVYVPWATIQERVMAGPLPESAKVAAANNRLYRVACYVALYGVPGRRPGFEVPVEN